MTPLGIPVAAIYSLEQEKKPDMVPVLGAEEQNTPNNYDVEYGNSLPDTQYTTSDNNGGGLPATQNSADDDNGGTIATEVQNII